MSKYSAEKVVQDIINYIEEKFENKKQIIVAIDGRCAAGKTTLTSLLQKKTGANIFHMDDFFLRPEQRTPERFSQPGGNVDYERFEEVLKKIKSGEYFSYVPFDCKTMCLTEEVHVMPKELSIVEGAYSCHPILEKYYDIKIFLSINRQEQAERILMRNGEEQLETFQRKWIPLEEFYFEKCKTKERCDICFEF